MNLLSYYQNKIFNCLKKLEKKKIIEISKQLKKISVEMPPRNHQADLSCNAAMILSKYNNVSPIELGKTLKKNLLSNFNEFKNIEIAGPGFLNISFKISFWKEYLNKIIKLDSKYGSNTDDIKKYNIELKNIMLMILENKLKYLFLQCIIEYWKLLIIKLFRMIKIYILEIT